MTDEPLIGAMSAEVRASQEAIGYCGIPGIAFIFSKKDYLSPNWPKLKEAMLDNVRLSYEDLIDEEMAIRGWKEQPNDPN